jgi:hypothetical protein
MLNIAKKIIVISRQKKQPLYNENELAQIVFIIYLAQRG